MTEQPPRPDPVGPGESSGTVDGADPDRDPDPGVGTGPAPEAAGGYDDPGGDDLDDLVEGGIDPDLDDLDDALAGAAPGTVHLGYSEGQVAYNVYGGMHQYVQRSREYHDLAPEFVSQRLEGFVDPGYWTADGRRLDSPAAAALVRTAGGAVLVAAPGHGRHTASLRLLHGTGSLLREIRPGIDPEASGDRLSVTHLPLAAGQAYLLELPERPHQLEPSFLRDLAGYRRSLSGAGSCLVAIATPEVCESLGAAHDEAVLRLGKPDPGEVMARYLRVHAPERGLSWVAGEHEVRELLADATPAEAVRLAGVLLELLAAQAGAGAQPDLTAGSAVARELVVALGAAYQNWEAELAAWFGANPGERARLFLVAAAVLHGASAGRVLRAAEDLAARLAGRPAGSSIAEAGLRELVATVEGRLGPGREVTFRRPRYAPAVMDFVLSDRSDNFQRELWRWVAELPLNTHGQLADTVDRVAPLVLDTALRQRSVDVLAQVVPVWARRPRLRRVLVAVLGVAALSSEIGSATRQRLYRWAIGRNHPSVLVAVAEVCAAELGDYYLDQALIRLGQLTQHRLPEVEEAVIRACLVLWERPVLRAPLLCWFARWVTEGTGERPRFGLLILSELSVPPVLPLPGLRSQLAEQLLAEPSSARSALAEVLSHLLTVPQVSPLVEQLLHAWFESAADDAQVLPAVGQLVGAAVAGGPGAARRAARLHAALHLWQPPSSDGDRPRRAAVRAQLVDQIYRAGAGLAGPPRLPTRRDP